MRSAITSYIMAMIGVAVVAWIASTLLPVLGLASSVLLFLLPVLYTAARGSIGAALFAALFAGIAYNYFLLPPRFTFRIHGLDNLISLFVLLAVAAVTSRLASKLRAGEVAASARAARSAELAELSALLSEHALNKGVERGISFLSARYGELQILSDVDRLDFKSFSSLDQSAAAWARHNRDITGHGTAVMPTSEWTFFPLAPQNRRDEAIAALARPASGPGRSAEELEHIDKLCLVLGQFRDSEALENVRREREILEARDSLQRALLASLAHDFRTPLTVISGQMERLARTSSEAREALTAAKRLDRMMSDLLGVARLEQGTLSPKMESIDLVDAVGTVCDDRANHPVIGVKRKIPADLPFVSADPVLLHHVLVNLFDNALRHANQEVAWAATRDGVRICLSICDDGLGIPANEQAEIFDRFRHVKGGDRTGGSGLGLAIVKGFSDAMGMTVTVETAPSGGACFTLSIPVVRGATL
jgi:two-component system sensor histidine kinase KdpD